MPLPDVRGPSRTRIWSESKRALKAVRGWVPLNHALTSALRAAVPEGGRQSELLARYLPRVGSFETPLPDGRVLKMWSNADDEITSAVYWGGWAGHEPETSRCFWDLAASAGVTFDIGAHVGYFSLLAALANPAGQVHAFEPLPVVLERLRRNVVLNGLKNVDCHQLALDRDRGTEKFYYLPDCIPSSSSLSRSFMDGVARGRGLVASDVKVTTVDDFVLTNEVGRVDLVKIDTESTEDAVLAGMVDTITRDRPVLICEILPGGPSDAVEELLRPLKYQYFVLTDSGPRQCPHVTPHKKWRNFLFRPENGSSPSK